MIIGAIGHHPRKLNGYYNKQMMERLTDLAKASLIKFSPERVISPMNLGWETAIATAAIRLDIPLTVVMPYDDQESHWTFEQQRKFSAIVCDSTNIVRVSSGSYSSNKMKRCNRFIVDNSNQMLVLWNGSPGHTANSIEYAHVCELKIVNTWNSWMKYR